MFIVGMSTSGEQFDSETVALYFYENRSCSAFRGAEQIHGSAINDNQWYPSAWDMIQKWKFDT